MVIFESNRIATIRSNIRNFEYETNIRPILTVQLITSSISTTGCNSCFVRHREHVALSLLPSGHCRCQGEDDGQTNGLLKIELSRQRRPKSVPAYGDISAQDNTLTADYRVQSSVEATLEDQLTVLRQIRYVVVRQLHW